MMRVNYSSLTRTAGWILCAALLGTSAHAQQKPLQPQSGISFVTKQMGVPLEGRYKKFDAQIAFDPAKPESGNIAFTT